MKSIIDRLSHSSNTPCHVCNLEVRNRATQVYTRNSSARINANQCTHAMSAFRSERIRSSNPNSHDLEKLGLSNRKIYSYGNTEQLLTTSTGIIRHKATVQALLHIFHARIPRIHSQQLYQDTLTLTNQHLLQLITY